MRSGMIGALASAMLAGVALAADDVSREVTLGWVVVPTAPSSTPINAKPGDIVLRQRLLPLGYATLAADALDAKSGNLVAPANTALLRLQASGGVVYCVAADPKRTALARAKPGSPYLRACFLDGDKDGRFESSAEYDGKTLPLPSIFGRLPKHMHVLTTPVAYTGRPLQDYTPAMFVGIKFDGFSQLSGQPVFKDVYGHDEETDGLNRAWPRANDGKGQLAKTGTVLLDGARIEVVENDGTTLKVRVDATIPAGVFGVRQLRGTYFF